MVKVWRCVITIEVVWVLARMDSVRNEVVSADFRSVVEEDMDTILMSDEPILTEFCHANAARMQTNCEIFFAKTNSWDGCS